MSARTAGVGVVLIAAIGGLLFAPVFTVAGLIVPVLAVAAAVGLADQLSLHRPGSTAWRPALAVAAGLTALAGTVLRDTLTGYPAGDSARVLRTAVLHGWQLTLDAAWPAPTDPELVLFVPLLVLVAAVVGVELLRRGWALAALLPGLALAALAQAYAAAAPLTALAAGLGYCLAATLVLAGGTPGAAPPSGATQAGGTVQTRGPRRAAGTALAVVTVVLAGGAVAWVSDRADRPAASLRQLRPAAPQRSSAVSPLDEIGERLRTPNRVVFQHWAPTAPDRWPVVVLDGFDGGRWTSSARYHRLGAGGRTDPSVTVPTRVAAARVAIVRVAGPWLPGPGGTVDVAAVGAGATPLVDDGTGTLLAGPGRTADRYDVRWAVPEVTADRLAGAALDVAAAAPAPADLPATLNAVARRAVGPAPATLRTALALEGYLRRNYRVATGGDLPTGHDYRHLQHFLTTGRRGTSEQFATAYVLLARSLGLPARLVVGFRQPATAGPGGRYTVRNGDVLAWPEVRVAGVGWVPLDPTAQAGAGRTRGGLAAAIDQVRNARPPVARPTPSRAPAAEEPEPDAAPPTPPAAAPGGAGPLRLAAAVAVGMLVLLTAGVAGVPLAKRRRTRRRRQGHPVPVITGAWLEVRDRLLDHGVPVRRGATVRELAHQLPAFVDEPARAGLQQLGDCVDAALWSPDTVRPQLVGQSWQAVDAVTAALARRPLRARVRAAIAVHSLRGGR